ncbi:hypothetical protein AOLI_G00294560 [Acnodon oligacanthus]
MNAAIIKEEKVLVTPLLAGEAVSPPLFSHEHPLTLQSTLSPFSGVSHCIITMSSHRWQAWRDTLLIGGQGLQLSSTPSLAVDNDYNAQAVIAQREQSSLTTSQQPRMTLTPFVDLVMLFRDSGAGFCSHLRPWEQTDYSCISVSKKERHPQTPLPHLASREFLQPS